MSKLHAFISEVFKRRRQVRYDQYSKSAYIIGSTPPPTKQSIEDEFGRTLDICCRDSRGVYMTKREYIDAPIPDPWKLYHRVQPSPGWLLNELSKPST